MGRWAVGAWLRALPSARRSPQYRREHGGHLRVHLSGALVDHAVCGAAQQHQLGVRHEAAEGRLLLVADRAAVVLPAVSAEGRCREPQDVAHGEGDKQ